MNQTTHDITAAIGKISAEIRLYEARYGRAENSVQLLAVSKTKPLPALQHAIDAGQRAFGENYPDEALEKIAALGKCDCEWHFIGSIQSRKAAALARHFDWVHSVDRLKVAKRLSASRPGELGELNICLQVNIDNEASKSGVSTAELPEFADAVATLPGLKLRGLMAIPAPRSNLDEQRAVFARVRDLQQSLLARHPGLDTLSMGMSGDLEAAIAEGATIVRIGTALFGARPPLRPKQAAGGD